MSDIQAIIFISLNSAAIILCFSSTNCYVSTYLKFINIGSVTNGNSERKKTGALSLYPQGQENSSRIKKGMKKAQETLDSSL